MRYVAVSTLLLAATLSAQTPPMWISISEGASRAGLAPKSESYTTGGPWAAVPAQRLNPESQLVADHFRIRAWAEDGAARVSVFAVVEDPATKRETETLISTFVIRPGESVEVTQTERYGAAHVVVTASDERPVASADRLNVRVSIF